MSTKTPRRKRKANMLDLQDPQFVTLTATPANRAGFKVIRSDGAKSASSLQHRVDRILQRKDLGGDFVIRSILLPEEVGSEDEAKVIGRAFDLEKEYELHRQDDGRYVYRSKDYEDADAVIVVEAGDGFQAEVLRSDTQGAEGEDQEEEARVEGVKVVAIRFDPDVFFKPDAISEWAKKNEIDFNSTPEDDGQSLVVSVSRSDEPTEEIQVERGVIVEVAPSDKDEVPGGSRFAGIVRSVSYGNWGWGATDFNVAMADRTFSEWMDSAIRNLGYVLEEVAFFTPSEERTPEALSENISRVVLQFAASVASMAATLPRGVQNADKTDQTEEEPQMPINTTDAGQEQNERQVQNSDNTEGTKETTQTVEGSVEQSSNTSEETTAARTDESTTASKGAEDTNAALAAAITALTTSIEATRNDNKALKEQLEAMNEKITSLESSTIERSDDDQTTVAEKTVARKDSNDSVFKGVLFRTS